MGIIKRAGLIPVFISFLIISMFCFLTIFAPILYMTHRFDYHVLFASAFGMALIVTTAALISLRDISPTKSMLLEKVHPETLETPYANNPDWQKFKLKIQANDEIWKWTAWGMVWFWFGGHHGYVIVRNNQVTRDYILDDNT